MQGVGANWAKAALPQVLPNFASYVLFRFEINVRGPRSSGSSAPAGSRITTLGIRGLWLEQGGESRCYARSTPRTAGTPPSRYPRHPTGTLPAGTTAQAECTAMSPGHASGHLLRRQLAHQTRRCGRPRSFMPRPATCPSGRAAQRRPARTRDPTGRVWLAPTPGQRGQSLLCRRIQSSCCRGQCKPCRLLSLETRPT